VIETCKPNAVKYMRNCIPVSSINIACEVVACIVDTAAENAHSTPILLQHKNR